MRLVLSLNAPSVKTFAIDECLVRLRAENKIEDTLHFYVRKSPCVSLGYFKSVKDIDLNYCKENDISVFRRITGGGTIYTDEKQLIYAVVRRADKNIQETIIKNCSAIINALKNFGINAEFKSPNDIIINGKKICGNAQIKIGDISLQHGTILIDCDFEKMEKVLKIKNLKEKLTTVKYKIHNVKIEKFKHGLSEKSAIKNETEILIEKLRKEIVKEFEKTLNVKIEKSELKNFEKKYINELIEEKYMKDNWNSKR